MAQYKPKTKYSDEQLDAAAKADLETDLRCALRDGQQEYAKAVQGQLDRITAGERAHLVVLKG
jgi:hypothetical protein